MPNSKEYCEVHLPEAHHAIYVGNTARTRYLKELYETIFPWIKQQTNPNNEDRINKFLATQATENDLEICNYFQFSKLSLKQQSQLLQYVLNKDNKTNENHLPYNILLSFLGWDEGLTESNIKDIFQALTFTEKRRELLQSLNRTDSLQESNELIEEHIKANAESPYQQGSPRIFTLFDDNTAQHHIIPEDKGESAASFERH